MHCRSAKTAHLFLDQDFKHLNSLIRHQINADGLEMIQNRGSNNWLVQIPQEASANRTYIENIFRDTPLRIDSYVFGFLQEGIGNKKYNIYAVLFISLRN